MKRPILDSGSAYKVVYLSKAPLVFTNEQMEKAMDHHIRTMYKELQAQGKTVLKINKSLHGIMGDVKIEAIWVVLGEKRTKEWRRRNASRLGVEQVSPDGHPAPLPEGGQAPSPV